MFTIRHSERMTCGIAGVLRFLLFAAALLLSACASQPPLPEQTPNLSLPLQLHI